MFNYVLFFYIQLFGILKFNLQFTDDDFIYKVCINIKFALIVIIGERNSFQHLNNMHRCSVEIVALSRRLSVCHFCVQYWSAGSPFHFTRL